MAHKCLLTGDNFSQLANSVATTEKVPGKTLQAGQIDTERQMDKWRDE